MDQNGVLLTHCVSVKKTPENMEITQTCSCRPLFLWNFMEVVRERRKKSLPPFMKKLCIHIWQQLAMIW